MNFEFDRTCKKIVTFAVLMMKNMAIPFDTVRYVLSFHDVKGLNQSSINTAPIALIVDDTVLYIH